jgi:hypothetical protein
MDILVQWFMLHIVSPLLLPLQIVATLAIIFGLKPESLVGALLEFTSAVLIAGFKLGSWCVLALYQMWRHERYRKGDTRVPPPPKMPRIVVEDGRQKETEARLRAVEQSHRQQRH